ncbi:hypothetical protein [Streptomyces sp. NPDC005876]|uniref:hypothetical protein n=1 Tax=unclassified Streptomyces TaxID=2593676 RepID=UPI0033D42487
MSVTAVRHDTPVLEAALLETLLAAPEAQVSDAPLPCPPCGHILLLGAKEPKEPKEPENSARR